MMDWKQVVGAVAPVLGSALGGPLGGVAVAAISDALLGKPDGSEGEIVTALKAGGTDALAKLRAADQAFALEMERVHQADRASARQANVAGGIQGRVFWLVVVIFCGVIGVEAAVLFGALTPKVDGQIVGRILGTLDAVLLAALYYVFGSSAGSSEKTALLARR